MIADGAERRPARPPRCRVEAEVASVRGYEEDGFRSDSRLDTEFMPTQHSGIDFVAYDRDGGVLLLAEAKSRHGTSQDWAAGLRRNMLAHGLLPWAKYFLIATPERMYLWKQERPNLDRKSVV